MSCGRSLEGNELQTDPDRRQSSLQKSPSQEGSNPFYPRLETDRSSTPIIGTVVVADFSRQTVSLIMASIKPWCGISNGKERRISIPIHMFRVLGLIYTRSVIDMEDFKQRMGSICLGFKSRKPGRIGLSARRMGDRTEP